MADAPAGNSSLQLKAQIAVANYLKERRMRLRISLERSLKVHELLSKDSEAEAEYFSLGDPL
jgi:hypothetical protein